MKNQEKQGKNEDYQENLKTFHWALVFNKLNKSQAHKINITKAIKHRISKKSKEKNRFKNQLKRWFLENLKEI